MAAPKIADRVKETTATTGTGSYTLAGAVAGFRAFSSPFVDGDTVQYAATDGTGWEVGYGVLSSTATVLARTQIIASSNAGAAVSWSAGSKDIWCNAPAREINSLRTMDGYGCEVSNNTTDATNDLDFTVGRWRSDDDIDDIALTAAITKRVDATWTVGSGNGGLDEGTPTNSTYHNYLIKRPDTGVVDVLMSRNPERTATFTVTIATPGVVTSAAHGLTEGSSFVPTTTGALPTGMTASTRYYVIATSLTADTFRFAATQGGAAINTTGTQSGVHTLVSSPVMPTNYTLKRYISMVPRESAALVGIVQTGDDFFRKTPAAAWQTTTPGSTAVTRQMASFPIGRRVLALLTLFYDDPSSGNFTYVSDLRLADATPGFTNATNTGTEFSVVDVWTDNAGQVRTRISANPATRWDGNVRGWRDNRGRPS